MTFGQQVGIAPNHMQGALTWAEVDKIIQQVRENNLFGRAVGKCPPLRRVIPMFDLEHHYVFQIEFVAASGGNRHRSLCIEARHLPPGMKMWDVIQVYLTRGIEAYREHVGETKPKENRARRVSKPMLPASPFAAPIPQFKSVERSK